MPSPNNQDSMPQGALNATAPAPAAVPNGPPQFRDSPFGYGMDPSIMNSMDPVKMMQMLKMSTIPDEDIRRNKFFAGLSAPTRSGSFGESMSNALGGYADTAEEQKKLMAQYAPMMMQHMIAMRNSLITGAESQNKLVNTWNSGLNARVGALLRSGNPVTPEALHGAIEDAGAELTVPGAYQERYFQGLAGDAQPGQNISDAIRTRILSGQSPEKQQATIAPPKKGVDVGPAFIPNAEQGSPGFTPPANMPQPLTKGPNPPQVIEPKMGTDKFGQATIDYKGQHAVANTPQGMQLFQQYNQDKAMAASAAGQMPPGMQPQPGAVRPPMPAQGAPTLPQGAAPQGAAPQGAVPPIPQQGATGATGPTSMPSKMVAPGVVAVNTGKPDPALAPGEVGKPVAGSTLPAGSSVQFTDIPKIPPLINNAGGYDPMELKTREDNYTQFQKDTAAQKQTVSSMQEALRRGNIIQDLMQRVKFGKTADIREDLAGVTRDIMNSFPGVNEATVNAFANKAAGGDLAALEEMGKLSVSGAMVGLGADMPRAPGQKIAMQEFMMYLKAVPNADMNPMAVAGIRENALRDYMRARTEQDARAQFLKGGASTDYGQFDSWWSAKQDALKLVPTNLNIGGGKGSGVPFSNVDFMRDTQGRAVIKAPDPQNPGKFKYYLPNEKFITSHWAQ